MASAGGVNNSEEEEDSVACNLASSQLQQCEPRGYDNQSAQFYDINFIGKAGHLLISHATKKKFCPVSLHIQQRILKKLHAVPLNH